MLEPSGELDLPVKALRAERRRELGVENFEGDRSLVFEIAREVDRGHSAPTQLALDRVTARKGRPHAL